jgi:hypothetical protein
VAAAEDSKNSAQSAAEALEKVSGKYEKQLEEIGIIFPQLNKNRERIITEKLMTQNVKQRKPKKTLNCT